jgi:hypothetical protein
MDEWMDSTGGPTIGWGVVSRSDALYFVKVAGCPNLAAVVIGSDEADTYNPLLSCNLTRFSTNRLRTQGSFQRRIMTSRDLSRTCTGSFGSSHQGETEAR